MLYGELGRQSISVLIKSKMIGFCQRLVNTCAAKPLKKPISQCQACFIDWFIISFFKYLPINYFLKISACYISLERIFIAEYSDTSIIKLFSLNREIPHRYNPVATRRLESSMAVNL